MTITIEKNGQELSREYADDKEDFSLVIEDMLDTLSKSEVNRF